MNELQQTLELPETLGYRLRHAREKQGLSVEDAADRLCISSAMINDIEKDQYDGERNTVFMRGHIRSYGRLLGLPKEEIQTALIVMGLVEPSIPIQPMTFKMKHRSAKDRPIRFISYGIIILLLILVIIWRY